MCTLALRAKPNKGTLRKVSQAHVNRTRANTDNNKHVTAPAQPGTMAPKPHKPHYFESAKITNIGEFTISDAPTQQIDWEDALHGEDGVVVMPLAQTLITSKTPMP